MDFFTEKFYNKPKIEEATENDVSNILKLQQNNLPENLSEEERKMEGFVTFQATPEMMSEIVAEGGSVVAKSNNKIVGYLISISPEKGKQIPFFEVLINEVNKLNYKDKPLNQYKNRILVQIAIDKEWRGKGLVEGLYSTLKDKLSDKYDLAFSEISEDNSRSLHVHIDKLGFKNIGNYEAEGKNWVVVVQDFKS